VTQGITYWQILGELEGFDAWLNTQGITVQPNDRIHQALKWLRKAAEASQRGRETGNFTRIEPRDWFFMVEALEAHNVFRAFRDDPTAAFTAELRRALSGPEHPTLETTSNRDGRNVWYQLALGAAWKLRGAQVEIREPDLRIYREGFTFLLACKRPAKDHSVHANIRGAVTQLREALSSMPPGTYGVVAINLTCVLNPGDKVLVGDPAGLGRIVESYIEKHAKDLRSINDPRICCALFDATTPGSGVPTVDMTRVYHAIGKELHPSDASKTFIRHSIEIRDRPE
jgi:hypothetical protein